MRVSAPGASVQIRMLYLRPSIASTFDSPQIPPLAAPELDWPKLPIRHEDEDELTMPPPPFSRIHLNTGWVQQKVPLRCTRITLSQLASLALAKVSSSRMPALFTRISARPKFLMASSNTDWPPAMVEMSETLATARPPSALIDRKSVV